MPSPKLIGKSIVSRARPGRTSSSCGRSRSHSDPAGCQASWRPPHAAALKSAAGALDLAPPAGPHGFGRCQDPVGRLLSSGIQRRPEPMEVTPVLTVTRDMLLPTTITGSYPRPQWFGGSLAGRSFKAALGDSLFREQYFDAVASIIAEQEAAGLDIVTDGDSRFDLT